MQDDDLDFPLCAIVLFAAITFATLSPIQMRPHLGEANLERALAYVLFGFVLGFGFPIRLARTMLVVCTTAGILELLQLIDPGRHARFRDALVKAAAGLVGIAFVRLLQRDMIGTALSLTMAAVALLALLLPAVA
ncbi:VanZ family protein [Mesorhizobium sp. BH1-1-5]|uniref:VanZ family protein n=1 Tax=Mesorhizobium sp. BH1-1-5 TaxID=2876661 RepID=UPI001CCC8FDD|nr:VanZ family protein [Mesorhizobium sp. BH1-1-5]MBZ9991653.1 VanZ family protein [Mesorhizobium sp. BH1-1-5]